MSVTVHLDTNYLIQFAGGKVPGLVEQVFSWIQDGIPLHVSAMAWAEFRSGPLTEDESTLILEITTSVIPVTMKLATQAGHLFEKTGRRPRSLADCIIAATAISEKASLATLNRADFAPFVRHGLRFI